MRRKKTELEKRLAEVDLPREFAYKRMALGGATAEAVNAGIMLGWSASHDALMAFKCECQQRYGEDHFVVALLERARCIVHGVLKEVGAEAQSFNPYYEEEEAARQEKRDEKERNKLKWNLNRYLGNRPWVS